MSAIRIWESPDLINWAAVRDWTNALTPLEDTLDLNSRRPTDISRSKRIFNNTQTDW